MPHITNIWIIIFSTVVGVMAYAMMLPVNIIHMNSLGWNATVIGIFSALPPMVIFLLAHPIGQLMEKYGRKRLYLTAKIIIALISIMFMLSDSIYVWLVTNIIIGLCAAALWPIGDSYIAEYAPQESKGKYTGIYQMLLGASYAIGPFIPAYFTLTHSTSIIIITVIGIVSTIPVFRLDMKHSADSEPSTLRLKHALVLAPMLLIMAVIGGMYEVGTVIMGTVHAINIGIVAHSAAYVAAAIGLGSFLCQYPMGIMADRMPVQRLINIAIFVLLLSSAATLFISSFAGMIVIALLWGAFGGAIYTLCMIKVSREFSGSDIRMITSLMISAYTLGFMIAPPVSGMTMDAMPRYGLPAFLTIVSVIALCAITLWGRKQLKKPNAAR